MSFNRDTQKQISNTLAQVVRPHKMLYNEKSTQMTFAAERRVKWEEITMVMNRTCNMEGSE